MSYSDEKIAIGGADDLPKSVEPSIAELSSDPTAGASIALPSRSIMPLSFTQTSGLSPSPSLHSRRISDTSIVSEENDTPTPYNVRDDKAPLGPFFTPTFQTALQRGLEIPRSIVAAIERLRGSSEPRDGLKRLLNNAKDLSTFQSSDTRTIAVLGDSGEGDYRCCQSRSTIANNMLAGKSSLINALLHCPEIAKTVSW
jgi:hypothetical protein